MWIAVWVILVGSALRIAGSSLALWLGTTILSAGIAAANVLLPPLIKRDFGQHAARYIALYACVMSLAASLASGIAVPLAALSGAGWFLSLGIWLVPAAIALTAWLPLLKGSDNLQRAGRPFLYDVHPGGLHQAGRYRCLWGCSH